MRHGNAPVDVAQVFGPVERVCPKCGTTSFTAARACPACGTPYVARGAKRLSTGRARAALAAGVVLIAAVIVSGVLLLAPGINRSKREQAAATRHAAAAQTAVLLRREAAEQRPHAAFGRAHVAGPSAPAAVRLVQRTLLVSELEQAIAADARARVRAGTLTGPVLYTTCSAYPTGSPAPQSLLATRVGAYQCLAVNVPIKNQNGTVGALGDPFWARIDFATSRLAWCKINPRAGERAVGLNVPSVPLAPVCNLEVGAPGGSSRAAVRPLSSYGRMFVKG